MYFKSICSGKKQQQKNPPKLQYLYQYFGAVYRLDKKKCKARVSLV